jgi:hypothetical protein
MNDVLDDVKGSMAGVHMRTPVEEIVAAGRSRRRRRRVCGTVAGAVVVAGATMVALQPGTPAETAPPVTADTGPVHLHLAAFSVDTNPDGTVTMLTKAQSLDPATLRRALAQAGVPAIIKIGEFCRSTQSPPPGLDSVVRGEPRPDGTVVLVFTPSALPQGAELSIGILKPGSPGQKRAAYTLVRAGTPLRCSPGLPNEHPGG